MSSDLLIVCLFTQGRFGVSAYKTHDANGATATSAGHTQVRENSLQRKKEANLPVGRKTISRDQRLLTRA